MWRVHIDEYQCWIWRVNGDDTLMGIDVSVIYFVSVGDTLMEIDVEYGVYTLMEINVGVECIH